MRCGAATLTSRDLPAHSDIWHTQQAALPGFRASGVVDVISLQGQALQRATRRLECEREIFRACVRRSSAAACAQW